MTAEAAFESLTGTLQGQDIGDDGPDMASVDKACNLDQLVSVGFDNKKHSTNSVPRSYFFGYRARDRNQHSAAPQHPPGAVQRIATHRVEHHVQVTQSLFETSRRVIDDFVSADLT